MKILSQRQVEKINGYVVRHPAMGLCDCGTEVELSGFTNTCEGCGTDYNMSGQKLAPREFWGQETGETAEDILRYDSMTVDELLEGDE